MIKALLLLAALASGLPVLSLAQDTRPNFLIVVADDLGWSDIGPLGSEIRTPTLDALAEAGTLMTQFYVAPTCSPTRSSLLTGLDNHPAGVGTMHGIAAPNQTGVNYEAQLHDGVVTLAEGLASHGYETFMTGKWHLAVEESQRPHRRGFQRSYSLMPGGASHFADLRALNPTETPIYLEDGAAVTLPADFYSSINYTETLIEYLEARDRSKPFLGYLAYTAPHDPLQVPDDWLDRYAGDYDAGPGAIREARLRKLKASGIIPEDLKLWQLPNFPPIIPLHREPWSERDPQERAESTRRMEIFAAMVELMDEQLGRVIEHLRQRGDLDNTYVLFFSDNGASPTAPLVYPGNTVEWLSENWSLSPTDFGKPGGFAVQSQEWAHVSNTPWRYFKGQVGEGGIRSPFLIAGPRVPAGQHSAAMGHVMDITPSLFELAGIDPASDPLYVGKLLPQGVSLVPVWQGENAAPRQGFGTELFGSRALRDGDWKASLIMPPLGSGQWELFNMAKDPGEAVNLAQQQPEQLEAMLAAYDEYVATNGVIHPSPPPGGMTLRRIYPSECDWFCELRFEVLSWLPAPNRD
ncbi:MAG: arylsulfatase [Pseudomonadota bacterium]